jgi:hypothetical protein
VQLKHTIVKLFQSGSMNIFVVVEGFVVFAVVWCSFCLLLIITGVEYLKMDLN